MNTDYDSTSTSDAGIDQRPTKRARYSPTPAPTLRRILLEELDLEIALQERLSSAVESRVSWALLLQQQALERRRSNASSFASEFQESAISALEVTEEPCHILYTPQLRTVQRTQARDSALVSPNVPATTSLIEPTQPAVYSTRTRGAHRAVRQAPRKLLFLRNRATNPPQIVKLVCHGCGKIDFSSLQGLLNHCRIRHQLEFGSHDECVQRCAVLVESEEDQIDLVANGTEVGGISLPGLRRLFEIAVSGGQGIAAILSSIQPGRKETEYNISTGRPAPVEAVSHTATELGAHITQTLGHHVGSPALAPFLGRETKRRQIRSFSEDEFVDVFGHDATSRTSPWTMHYTHRSKPKASFDEAIESSKEASSVDTVSVKGDSNFVRRELQASTMQPGFDSRFHIVARVSIRDLSVWIPPDRRGLKYPEHTHRWRLAITSPSYSLPLSTFLRKLTVVCLTEPPPSTFEEPFTVSQSPFVFTGITDRPFLARLTFQWAGPDELNSSTTLEHWVELDAIHLKNPVLGEEQFFDVELDRNTNFLPLKEELLPDWNDGWEAVGTEIATAAGAQHEESGKEDDPVYVCRLRSLVPLFPLTLKDARGTMSEALPYKLVPALAQFRGLVYGRQKAIQWARARAIGAAYEQKCRDSPQEDGTKDIPLSTGDIFHWLEDENMPPKRQTSTSKVETSISTTAKRKQRFSGKRDEGDSESYCRFCGLQYHLHPNTIAETMVTPGTASEGVKPEEITAVIPSKPSVLLTCPVFNSSSSLDLPVMAANWLPFLTSSWPLVKSPNSQDHDVRHSIGLSSQALAAVADPDLVGFIASTMIPPVTASLMKKSRNEVEEEIAPAALLTLVAKLLTKTLIRAGSEVYRRDDDELRGLGRGRKRKDGQVRRLLTPMHVMRGLVHDAPRVREAGALLLLLAPLGVSLPSLPLDEDVGSGFISVAEDPPI